MFYASLEGYVQLLWCSSLSEVLMLLMGGDLMKGILDLPSFRFYALALKTKKNQNPFQIISNFAGINLDVLP